MRRFIPLAAAATCLFWAGCATVQTEPAEFMLRLDDYKEAALQTAGALLAHPAITEFPAANEGRLPRLDIGEMRNATRDPAVLEQYAERALEELLAGGQVTLVANDPKTRQITAVRKFMENGDVSTDGFADFYLGCVLSKDSARSRGMLSVTHTFFMELNDSHTRSQLWKKTYDTTRRGTDYRTRGGTSLF